MVQLPDSGPAPKRAITNVRLREDLLALLDDEARRRVVSRTYLIEAAIEQLLDDSPKVHALRHGRRRLAS
jgi:predicted transcriptional regulator